MWILIHFAPMLNIRLIKWVSYSYLYFTTPNWGFNTNLSQYREAKTANKHHTWIPSQPLVKVDNIWLLLVDKIQKNKKQIQKRAFQTHPITAERITKNQLHSIQIVLGCASVPKHHKLRFLPLIPQVNLLDPFQSRSISYVPTLSLSLSLSLFLSYFEYVQTNASNGNVSNASNDHIGQIVGCSKPGHHLHQECRRQGHWQIFFPSATAEASSHLNRCWAAVDDRRWKTKRPTGKSHVNEIHRFSLVVSCYDSLMTSNDFVFIRCYEILCIIWFLSIFWKYLLFEWTVWDWLPKLLPFNTL